MKHSRCDISVVVPVYNTKKYLEKCIRSIMGQNLVNVEEKLEVILVNDGSDDGTEMLCRELSDEYHNIVLINQTNQGQGAARIAGILNATGEFTAFVDSDDWIERGYYSKLLELARENDADLVTAGICYNEENGKNNVYDIIEPGVYEKTEIMNEILPKAMKMPYDTEQGILANLVCKLFKTDILKRHCERLDPRLSLYEDGALVYTYLMYINRMLVTRFCGYHYIQRRDSSIHSLTVDSLWQMKFLKDFLEQSYQDYGILTNMKCHVADGVGIMTERIIHDVLGIRQYHADFLPPFDKIKKGSRVVLYGAGKVGKSFRYYFEAAGYVKIVGWVDDRAEEIQYIDKIESVESIINKVYDIVLICVLNPKTVLEIKKNLIDIGVSSEKIKWYEVMVLDGIKLFDG